MAKAEAKTKPTEISVNDFLNKVTPEQKSKDAFELVELMRAVSKQEPKMWGPAIVGFGQYHYKYESGHEGDSCLIGFSPRKANLTLYVIAGGAERYEDLLSKLGKHKVSGSCLHINKLSEVDTKVLKAIIKETYTYMKEKHKSK